MDLQTIIGEEMSKATDPEKIRVLVAEGMEKLTKEAVDLALRSWNDRPGHVLRQKISDAIGVEIGRVDLQLAQLGLVSMVEQEVSKHLVEQVNPELEKRLKALFKPAPASIHLEALVNDYLAERQDRLYRIDGEPEGIGLVFQDRGELSNDYIALGLHPTPYKKKPSYGSSDEELEWYQCDIGLNLKKDGDSWKLYNLNIRHLIDDNNTPPTLAFTLSKFERRLYQMYLAGTAFEIDSTDADLYETAYEHPCEC